MKVIIASVLLCCSFALAAEIEPENQDVAAPVNFVLAAGLTLGGDDMAATTDGRTLEADGMIYLGAGAVYHHSPNLVCRQYLVFILMS
jgi:hypothetical protein